MNKTALWALGGLCLGGVIHIVAVLGVPVVTDKTPWAGIASLGSAGSFHLITRNDTPIGTLDPAMIHAACAFDLSGESASLELDFSAALWTVSVFDSLGRSVFALSGNEPMLGLDLVTVSEESEEADAASDDEDGAQPEDLDRQFAAQVPEDRGFIVLRIYSPYDVDRDDVLDALSDARCA